MIFMLIGIDEAGDFAFGKDVCNIYVGVFVPSEFEKACENNFFSWKDSEKITSEEVKGRNINEAQLCTFVSKVINAGPAINYHVERLNCLHFGKEDLSSFRRMLLEQVQSSIQFYGDTPKDIVFFQKMKNWIRGLSDVDTIKLYGLMESYSNTTDEAFQIAVLLNFNPQCVIDIDKGVISKTSQSDYFLV
ncbi:hypothetical protein WDZ92_49830, partial [Nostoc sp. NIES-2111]